MSTLKPLPKDLGTGTFQVEFQALIKVLGENLYANPRACVRELIQNANDSCVRRQAAGHTYQPAIRVMADITRRILVFEDNGAGMVQEDVIRYLASIGGGRTREERTRLSTEDKAAAQMLIGQFGIGFLSSFVVADRVVVDTLSIEGGDPVLWVCEGTSEYQIGRGRRREPGTQVTLHLKAAHYDLLEEETLYNTIIYYADFIGFPIYLNNQSRHINRMNAPWHLKGTDREYMDYIQHRYEVDPLAMMSISVDKKDLFVQGVLFVPPRTGEWKRHQRSIDIFQKRMFIGEDLNILPEWAGFVSGVLDCATLDLVASRESAISERPSYKALQEYLGEAVATFVQNLAKQNRTTFLEVVKQHEWSVKWGAVRSDFFFNQVKDIIPLASDMGQLTLPRYLQRVPKRLGGIKTIYYVSGQQMPGQQQSTIFRARGVPILRTDVVDEQFLKKYVARDPNVNLRQMVSGVIELMDFVEGDRWRSLEARYQAMGIHARGVTFHPPDMPALAVRQSESEPDRMIEQVTEGKGALLDFIGRIGKNTSDQYWLCFNVDNPIIQRLATYQGDEVILDAALRSIYSSALLAAGVELTADMSQAVAQSEMRVIELLLEQDERLQGKSKQSGYKPSALDTKIPATRYAAASFGGGGGEQAEPASANPAPAAAKKPASKKKKKRNPGDPYTRPFRYDPDDPWFPSRKLEFGDPAPGPGDVSYNRPYRERTDVWEPTHQAGEPIDPPAKPARPASPASSAPPASQAGQPSPQVPQDATAEDDTLDSRAVGNDDTYQRWQPSHTYEPEPVDEPEGTSRKAYDISDPYKERPYRKPVYAPWPDSVGRDVVPTTSTPPTYKRPFRDKAYRRSEPAPPAAETPAQPAQNEDGSLVKRLIRRFKK